MQCAENLELTSMEVPGFQFAGRHQSIWHLGCMNWSVYLSPCHILSVHHFLEEYSVDNTLHVPSSVCQALPSFGLEGNSFNVFSTVDLWMVVGWTKGYLACVQLPHCEVKFQNTIPIET